MRERGGEREREGEIVRRQGRIIGRGVLGLEGRCGEIPVVAGVVSV